MLSAKIGKNRQSILKLYSEGLVLLPEKRYASEHKIIYTPGQCRCLGGRYWHRGFCAGRAGGEIIPTIPIQEENMKELSASSGMKKSPLSLVPFVLVMGFILSCSVLGSADTGVPAATSTPKPADTIAPADTTEPEPTEKPEKPTADKAATSEAEAEETAAAEAENADAVLGEIEGKLDEVGERLGNGSVTWMDPGPLVIDSSKPNMVSYNLIDGVEVADFAYHANVVWETKQKVGIVYCVVMFRIEGDLDTESWYMMRMGRISGAGHVLFDVMSGWSIIGENGDYSNYIHDANGAENELILVAQANQFTVYVNGKQATVWWNTKVDRGGFGLGTLQDTGSSTCTFSNNWIWSWE
jgi:hypothetical protein